MYNDEGKVEFSIIYIFKYFIMYELRLNVLDVVLFCLVLFFSVFTVLNHEGDVALLAKHTRV